MTRSEKIYLIALQNEITTKVDRHIDKQAKSLGYDDINSIAKYLVNGNPFQDECEKLSLWVASCWITVHTIQSDVEQGLRAIPTVQEVIDELPIYA